LKKSNLHNRNLRKTSPKTSNPQVLKKTQIHKKQVQIRGKTARLATLSRLFTEQSSDSTRQALHVLFSCDIWRLVISKVVLLFVQKQLKP